MIITLSGTPASGKSSIAKLLAKKLSYKHYSMGDLQRDIAKQKGITITELGILQSKDKSIDLMIDEKQKNLGLNEDNFVLDSRLSAKFINNSIKIFVDADPIIRAQRRFNEKRDGENFDDLDKTIENMALREKINQERFIKFYDFDFLDLTNYDLIIDSSSLNINECVDKIVDYCNLIS
ncbi:MAG: (d)CMP kinase [Candidatus Woesearchaeota archaeon]